MKTIWKFELCSADWQTVEMPAGARILSLQTQRGALCLWAVVDPSMTPEVRRFATYYTGDPLPDDPGDFVGTFQLDGGSLVFHVFELTTKT